MADTAVEQQLSTTLVAPSRSQVVSSQPKKDLRCYDVLGVSRFSTPTEIRQAYRCKAMELHPDRSFGQNSGFLSLAEAFEILSDAAQRGAYDRELAVSESRDGMSVGSTVPTTTGNAFGHRDPAILCLALVEIPSEEWNKHLADLPASTLREMHEHLATSKKRVGTNKRQRANTDSGRQDEGGATKPRHLCTAAAGKGFWCAQIQMCGVHIRSRATKHTVHAAESHLSLVSLKETFFVKWKENGMADFEEVFRASALEARSQKIYFPGAMHWFEKSVELEQGMRWRLTTPCTRDLEATLRNRSQVLALIERGTSKPSLIHAVETMRLTEKMSRAAWEEKRPALELRLQGYIECELGHRGHSSSGRISKRLRLRGKQSMTQLCVQLPWFSRFAAEQGISSTELEGLLPPIQARLRGAPSLEQCLQRALRNSLFPSGPPPAAIEDLSRLGVANSASIASKRKASARRTPALGNVRTPKTLELQHVQPIRSLQTIRPLRPLVTMQQEPQEMQEQPKQEEQSVPSEPHSQPLQQVKVDMSPDEEELMDGGTSVDVGASSSHIARDSRDARDSRELAHVRDVTASPSHRPQSGRSLKRKGGWRESYSCILHELLADPEVDRLFGHPVDVDMYPDYLSRIAPGHPVDLRLVLRRLGGDDGGYEDVHKCACDLSMVWENASRFNPPGSYVRAIAEQAATIIHDMLQGRRSAGRVWCRAPLQGQRSSLRPETRSRSQLSVQLCTDKTTPASEVRTPEGAVAGKQ
eukprot:CAMPEP_0172666898 /NCGR_PEP_ID=MMETSP1074-20121228/8092_1 /TAXON_ID=2916 /ORGANISM="Ceratium fusus, Strain PA161109" /LENGTH=755 /DNA_ID=CAMNT_0013483339 /DNA_START=131 /DNA_END=2398 /DNA_ORIENTATION=+